MLGTWPPNHPTAAEQPAHKQKNTGSGKPPLPPTTQTKTKQPKTTKSSGLKGPPNPRTLPPFFSVVSTANQGGPVVFLRVGASNPDVSTDSWSSARSTSTRARSRTVCSAEEPPMASAVGSRLSVLRSGCTKSRTQETQE